MAFLFWSIVAVFGSSALIVLGCWIGAERSAWFRKELVGNLPEGDHPPSSGHR